MNKDKITEELVRELRENASDGPWEWDDVVVTPDIPLEQRNELFKERAPWLDGKLNPVVMGEIVVSEEDARFIAALPDIAEAYLSKCAEVRELRDRVREWQPIETAPTHCEFFGWCVNEKGVEWFEPRCRVNEDGCVEVYGRVDFDHADFEPVSSCSYFRVTHWMPLPEAPTHD